MYLSKFPPNQDEEGPPSRIPIARWRSRSEGFLPPIDSKLLQEFERSKSEQAARTSRRKPSGIENERRDYLQQRSQSTQPRRKMAALSAITTTTTTTAAAAMATIASAPAKSKKISFALYDKLVGESDGGVHISKEEYQRLVELYHATAENKLRVSWMCKETMNECVRIGGHSRCYCSHSYRAHAWWENESKQVHCRVPGCECKCFDFLNQKGTWVIHCNCKHGHADHYRRGQLGRCMRCPCDAFFTSYTCHCGRPWVDHETHIENERERAERGVKLDREIVQERLRQKKKLTCNCMGCKNMMPCAFKRTTTQ